MTITKKQRNEMRDYLVEKLRGSNNIIEPVTRAISGIESDYIKVGQDGIVILVNRVYPNESLNQLYKTACQFKKNVAPVFFKDGETFFRNAAERHYFKKSHNLSLKHYTGQQMHQMILFRPEEIFVLDRSPLIQYYQPRSERLEQGLASFKFSPVRFDYSHIDSSYRFKPENRESDRLHIWTETELNQGNLRVECNSFRPQ